MTRDLNRLKVTTEPMDRLVLALDDSRENVLPNDPVPSVTMAEGPLDELDRRR